MYFTTLKTLAKYNLKKWNNGIYGHFQKFYCIFLLQFVYFFMILSLVKRAYSGIMSRFLRYNRFIFPLIIKIM